MLSKHHVVALYPDVAWARAALSQIITSPLRPRPELVAVHGPRAGSGREDGTFLDSNTWFAKSRRDRAFDDVGQGLVALERLAKAKASLGDLLPARTVLAVLRSPEGQVSLWTCAPRLVTVRERMNEAVERSDCAALAQQFCVFAHALGRSIEFALRSGDSLDASPSNFAVQGATLRYLDDDLVPSALALGVEDAFLARYAEYPSRFTDAWKQYEDRFVGELCVRVGSSDLHRLDLLKRIVLAARFRKGTDAVAERVCARLTDVTKRSSQCASP